VYLLLCRLALGSLFPLLSASPLESAWAFRMTEGSGSDQH
jgi:hypothetical protein